jgi:pantetheine-phosphate adenylyltransferase
MTSSSARVLSATTATAAPVAAAASSPADAAAAAVRDADNRVHTGAVFFRRCFEIGEDRLVVMNMLKECVLRVQHRLFVGVAPPASIDDATHSDGEALVRQAMLRMYDDVFSVQLELGTPDALKLDVIVVPYEGSLDLIRADDVLYDPSVQVVFGDGSVEELRRVGAVSNDRVKRGMTKLRYETLSQGTSPASLSDAMFFESPSFELSAAPFRKVVVGGTFDKLHVGHRKLLTIAAAVCTSTLVVGVTDSAMLQRKSDAADIAPFAERAAGVVRFVGTIKPSIAVDIVPISDAFGPTVTDPELEAIIVSSETLRGAHAINAVRATKGFKPLQAIVTQRDNAAVVSSSFLRKAFRAAT